MSIAQDERAGLAADLSRLGPDAPTLCKGMDGPRSADPPPVKGERPACRPRDGRQRL